MKGSRVELQELRLDLRDLERRIEVVERSRRPMAGL